MIKNKPYLLLVGYTIGARCGHSFAMIFYLVSPNPKQTHTFARRVHHRCMCGYKSEGFGDIMNLKRKIMKEGT